MSDIDDDDDALVYEALGRLCASTSLRIRVPGQPPILNADLAWLATNAKFCGGPITLLGGIMPGSAFGGIKPGTELLITVEPPV